jgi:hypothetical protein
VKNNKRKTSQYWNNKSIQIFHLRIRIKANGNNNKSDEFNNKFSYDTQRPQINKIIRKNKNEKTFSAEFENNCWFMGVLNQAISILFIGLNAGWKTKKGQ